MNIAGVGLEQDVAMKNVDMKIGPVTGAAGMAGSAASPHLLYFVILSVFRAVYGSIFGRLQAVGKYVRHPQGRRVRRAAVLSLPTLCLALAFVCFSAIGALAQDGPDGSFAPDWQKNHDGMTPFTMKIVFSSGNGFDASSFTASDITFAVPDPCTTCLPTGGNFERDYAPMASTPMADSENGLIWTFTVTPRTHNEISPDFSVTIPANSVADLLGQQNSFPINMDGASNRIIIRYMDPPPPPPLVADAGPDQPEPGESAIISGTLVTLDGSDSTAIGTAGGRTVSYAWTRTSGAGRGTGGDVTLTGADAAMPTFTPPDLTPGATAVTYGFTLTVTDDVVGSSAATDTVTITVTAPLFADAGPDQPEPGESAIISGTLVTLDGSDSTAIGTAGGRTVSYAWTRTSGAGRGTGGDVTLTGADTAMPTFTPPDLTPGATAVTYGFTLTVTDDVVGSSAATDTVTITVTAPLFADAGPDQPEPGESAIISGTLVTLDGSDSTAIGTAGGRTVSYAWTRTSGAGRGTGGDVTLTGADTAMPTFTPPDLTPGATAVTYGFTLTVTDDVVGSSAATDTVTITVTAPLFADAGPDQPEPGESAIISGTLVTLDGSDSTAIGTAGGRTVSYAWTRTSGAGRGTGGDVTLTGADTAMPTFTPPDLTPGATAVTYGFTLTVTDDVVGSSAATDTVTITVTAPLFADAGPDQPEPGESAIISGTLVTLDGSDSTAIGTAGGRTVSYAWTRTSGAGRGTGGDVTLTGADTAMPTFTPPDLTPGATAVTYGFTLTVTDDVVGSSAATDTVTITVTAPLFADAGPDQPEPGESAIISGTLVTLDGSDSTAIGTAGGRTVSYAWTRTSGAGRGTGGDVTLTGADTAMPTFTPPDLTPGATAVTYGFTLTVTDDVVGSSAATDTVTITVTAPLFADAGPDQPEPGESAIISGTLVTLDGSDSTAIGTAGGRTVSYAWTRTSGAGRGTGGDVTLTGADTAMPTFTPPDLTPGATAVTYGFTLTVTDDVVGSSAATDTVTITVTAPLFADAGPDQPEPGESAIISGTLVTLDGSDSTAIGTAGGRTVSYAWTRTSGAGRGTGGDVTLTGADTAMPTFTPPDLTPGATAVTYGFTLTVTDDVVGSSAATDTVTITVTAPLFADAGPDQPEPGESAIISGTLVTLDGSDSTVIGTAGGRTVSYAWTRTSGAGRGTGGDVTLTGADTAMPTFTPPDLTPGATAVTYGFTLTVTDDVVGSTAATDTVTITVTAPLAPLFADAGPDQPEPGESAIISGTLVTLDGSDSTAIGTAGGRTVSYAWTRTSGAGRGTGGDVTLTGADTAMPTFTPPALTPGATAVTYGFTLTVSDDQSSRPATSTVTVTVTAVSVDIVVSPSDLKVQEGGSGTYRVRLSESPGREVTIMATSGNEAVVRLKNTRLVFNANNWNDWQEVEIDAVADSVKKGDRIEVTIQHSLNGVASNKLVTVSVRAQEDDPILDHVGQFIATRATTLLGQQPDLIHFLKQDGLTQDSGGSFTFQATDGRLSLDGGFIHDGTWGEVTGARTNSESTDTKSVLGSFGIHRKYSETFLTGLMLQFDRADHELPQQTGTIDGTGWLVGPYFVARHGSQPLYFEGRLLYGYSDNDIRFMDRHLGARTGSFDSTRVLAQIRVEGEIAVPGWDHGDDGGAEVPQLIPYADLRWLEDRAAAFTTVSATTGFRVPVPGQTVNISQLELGSNMVVPVAVPTGSMILTGGLGLVFSNTEGNHIKSDAHGRGRGEIGFSYGLDENVQIDFESFYDGIGSSGYEGYGLSLNAEMRF